MAKTMRGELVDLSSKCSYLLKDYPSGCDNPNWTTRKEEVLVLVDDWLVLRRNTSVGLPVSLLQDMVKETSGKLTFTNIPVVIEFFDDSQAV